MINERGDDGEGQDVRWRLLGPREPVVNTPVVLVEEGIKLGHFPGREAGQMKGGPRPQEEVRLEDATLAGRVQEPGSFGVESLVGPRDGWNVWRHIRSSHIHGRLGHPFSVLVDCKCPSLCWQPSETAAREHSLTGRCLKFPFVSKTNAHVSKTYRIAKGRHRMSSSMVSGGGLPATVPASHTGLDSLPAQLIARLQKRGFVLNLLVAGRGGLGKSTLVNTLFAAPLSETGQGSAAPASLDSGAPRKTTEISVASHLLSENGVQVRLSIIDTPGFGDLINNENAWEPIVKYIKDQYSLYLRRELTPNRDRQIIDTRVHAVLYFLFPSGHGLAPLDLLAMKALSETCNVIPIIAKSDALTLDEREAFKARVREELRVHGIQVYPNIYGLDFETLDEDQRAANDVVSVCLDTILFLVDLYKD